MYNNPVHGIRGFGKLTQNAGTVITRLVPPLKGSITRLTSMWYNCSTTPHTLTVMRPLGKTFASAAAAASQAVINIERDPGVYNAYGTVNTGNNVIAANDFCVYQTADGNYVVDTVSSVATLAITMTTNVPTATVLKGAPFWFFGIITDTNPADNLAHPQFTLPASTVTIIEDQYGFINTLRGLTTGTLQWPLNGLEEPVIVHSGNATAAGVLERLTAVYTAR